MKVHVCAVNTTAPAQPTTSGEGASATTSHSSGIPQPFDTRSLTAPASPAEIRAHARGLERNAGIRARPSWFNVGFAIAVILMIGIPTSILFGILALEQGIVWGILATVIALATISACVLVVFTAARQVRAEPEQRFRLQQFADDNDLLYVPTASELTYTGRIFTRGQERVAHDVIRQRDDSFEAANYSYATIGYRGTRIVWGWGYVTAPIAGSAPPLLLDAITNNGAFNDGITNPFEALIPTHRSAPDGAEFRLWARPSDRTAASTFVSDELLHQLARRPADLEIVHGRVFLYVHGSLELTDPSIWAWAQQTIRAIQQRAAEG